MLKDSQKYVHCGCRIKTCPLFIYFFQISFYTVGDFRFKFLFCSWAEPLQFKILLKLLIKSTYLTRIMNLQRILDETQMYSNGIQTYRLKQAQSIWCWCFIHSPPFYHFSVKWIFKWYLCSLYFKKIEGDPLNQFMVHLLLRCPWES